jgi:hypothetical protein
MRRKMCIYKCMLNVYKNQQNRQTGSRNQHICTFFVTYFSATIDGRGLIFGQKLHIGTPYRGKHFWIHQIPTSCLPTLLIFTGSRNLTGPKSLPTIWHTYMKLVIKYQIPVMNICWEKCDEKCAYMLNVYKSQLSRQTAIKVLSFEERGYHKWALAHSSSCFIFF